MTPSASRARLLGTLAIVSGTFLSVLSSTIIYVPLGDIAHDLRVSIAAASLIVTAQGVTFATLLPACDWAGNRFGRRNIFCAAIALHGVSGTAAMLAPNLATLVAMRILQGVAAAAIVPLVMTLLADLYEAHQRALALSAWAMANSAGQALGPPLGGILTALFGWRAIFAPAPLIAAVSLVAAIRYLPPDPGRPLPLEWRGAVSLTVAAALLFSGFTAIPQLGLHAPFVEGAGIGGALSLAIFVWTIRTAEHPFVSPQAFVEPAYLIACIGVTAATLVFGSGLLAIPLYLTQSLHVPTAGAGFVTLVLPLSMALVAPLTGRIVRSLGSTRTIAAGLAALALGSAAIGLAVGERLGIVAIAAGMIPIGATLAAVYTAGAVGSTATAAGRYGAGIGFFNLLRIAGAAIGAALVAIVLQAQPGGYGAIFAIDTILAVGGFVAVVAIVAVPRLRSG